MYIRESQRERKSWDMWQAQRSWPSALKREKFRYSFCIKKLFCEQTKQKQTHRCRELTDGCPRGEGLGGWVYKVKGLRSTNQQLQNSHRGVKYSIGNIVNDILITMYGTRQVLEILVGILCKVYDSLTTMLYTGN